MYNEVKGDLIELALTGCFDVVAHGCNCMCTMGAGVAVGMKNAFECDRFPLEHPQYKGDINKLGQIDWEPRTYATGLLSIVNAYTQYNYGRNHEDGDVAPFDYEAFTLCMRKVNHIFKGQHLGIPAIGSHLAGGDWDRIKQIIKDTTPDIDVTVVIWNKK